MLEDDVDREDLDVAEEAHTEAFELLLSVRTEDRRSKTTQRTLHVEGSGLDRHARKGGH